MLKLGDSSTQSWIQQLRWQRLKPFDKLANLQVKPLDGILNDCRTPVPFGVVEEVNANPHKLHPARPWLPQPALADAEGSASGVVISRAGPIQESRMNRASSRIPAQNRKSPSNSSLQATASLQRRAMSPFKVALAVDRVLD